MKTTQYQITLPPREELAHLVRLVSGLLASGQCRPNAGHFSDNNGAAELPVARVIARELLEQLRDDVQASVNTNPERYGLAAELPSE